MEGGFYISGYDYLGSLDSFNEGHFAVQDVSSMLVGVLAGVEEGDNVIDVCAAPGGKSLHMADLLKGTGHVSARDLTEYKVDLINDNIERLGFLNISADVKDAAVKYDEDANTADIVIADLPCSGLGVLGKKADLKYKTLESDPEELSKIQKSILNTERVCTMNSIAFDEENGKHISTRIQKFFKRYQLSDILRRSNAYKISLS